MIFGRSVVSTKWFKASATFGPPVTETSLHTSSAGWASDRKVMIRCPKHSQRRVRNNLTWGRTHVHPAPPVTGRLCSPHLITVASVRIADPGHLDCGTAALEELTQPTLHTNQTYVTPPMLLRPSTGRSGSAGDADGRCGYHFWLVAQRTGLGLRVVL